MNRGLGKNLGFTDSFSDSQIFHTVWSVVWRSLRPHPVALANHGDADVRPRALVRVCEKRTLRVRACLRACCTCDDPRAIMILGHPT